MDRKNNKMDKIQHTHSKAHVKAPAEQKTAVAIFACTTADPLTHRQIHCSFPNNQTTCEI